MSFDDYKEEAWVEKCRKCTHNYYKKGDADTMYCRCRKDCNFKEYKPNQNKDSQSIKKELSIIRKAIKKLGELESIEKDMECQLKVVFKALNNGIYYKNGYVAVVSLVYNPIDKDYEFTLNNGDYVYVYDYKKTWWLKVTKEE